MTDRSSTVLTAAIVLFVLLGLGLATQATTVQDRVQAAWTG